MNRHDGERAALKVNAWIGTRTRFGLARRLKPKDANSICTESPPSDMVKGHKPAEHRDQKMYLKPNCISRIVRAVVILPNVDGVLTSAEGGL